MSTEATDNYLLFNEYQTKNLVVVFEIEGFDIPLSSGPLFTRIRYGDPDLFYGDAGLVYGGVRRLTDATGADTFRDYLSLDQSSLTLDQRIEPEQGRGSVSTLTLGFIDKDGFMSRLISPGVVLDDILGKNVKVRLGYKQISYPEDYFTIFRGVISQATSQPGLVIFQLSDMNIKRRAQIFYTAMTSLASDINDSTTTVPVVSNEDFHKQILGPDGTFDTAIHTYLKIDDEWIEYTTTGFGDNVFTSVTRGARNTTAASHTTGADVSCGMQIQDHCIDMALKLMLSGWNGPFQTDVSPLNLGFTGDPDLGTQPDAIVLKSNVDAVEDFGLSPGDWITITDAADPGNNQSVPVLDFGPLFGQPNRIIYIDGTVTEEIDTPAKLAFRSQYDTYPTSAGSKLLPNVVDIEQHQLIKQQFLVTSQNALRFFITDVESSGKDFIEKEVYLPISLYSLTRLGRLSVNITKPPIADQRLQIVDKDTLLDPQNVAPQRSLNNRLFYNEIQYYWDADDDGNFTSAIKILDAESLNIIGISSVLPIQSKGSRTDLGVVDQFNRRSEFLLLRYKRGAEQFNVKVNWEIGNQIEAGDVIALRDNNQLKITNLVDGKRNLGIKLYEVIRRTLDIKTGNVSLTLVSGVGSEATDRYGTISPSSLTDNGSTVDGIRIQDSFGSLFPHNESRKWKDYIGEPIRIHNLEYTYDVTTTLIGINPVNRYILEVSPPLTGAPPSGLIVDIIDYPNDPNPNTNLIYKTIHAFLDPTIGVVTGLSPTEFTVASGDEIYFFSDGVLRIRNEDFSVYSPDKTVLSVSGQTVTLKDPLSFTPSGGDFAELIGFYFDHGAPYRIL